MALVLPRSRPIPQVYGCHRIVPALGFPGFRDRFAVQRATVLFFLCSLGIWLWNARDDHHGLTISSRNLGS